jgi:hypothetical protein
MKEVTIMRKKHREARGAGVTAALWLTALAMLAACGGGQKTATGPRTDLKPFKEIDTIELFEKVFQEKGYETSRKQPIYIVDDGEWLIDLWVKGESLPLVVEYLTADDREKLAGKLKTSKVGEKFKLVTVAVEEIKAGQELNQGNSRFAVIFDDRDYVFQPNPKSEDRYEVTIVEIENRLRKDIVDVIEELEKVMTEEKSKAGEDEDEEDEDEDEED